MIPLRYKRNANKEVYATLPGANLSDVRCP